MKWGTTTKREMHEGRVRGTQEREQPTRAEGEKIRNRHEKYSRSRSGQTRERGKVG